MKKHILLYIILTLAVFGAGIKKPILSLDEVAQTATIYIEKIDIGMSGFIVHTLGRDNTSILKNVTVVAYNESTKIATLKMEVFDSLAQNALPTGNWKVEKGDIAILASGYSRAILIAPSDYIYYKITKASNQVQWIHPDIFATILSFKGHKTPLKEDFNKMSIATSVGLVFFYLNQKLYTVDSKSMKILNISPAMLKQTTTKLPFFSRLEEIHTDWFSYFDSASNEIAGYEEYYYALLLANNPNNKELKIAHEQYLNRK